MITDMSNGKWAIMVCITGNEDDWLFVTKDNGKCGMFNMEPIVFDDINEALEYANSFELPGKEHNVKVVNYDNA